MKKKVGISISEGVYKKVKVYCAVNNVKISELFEYAVSMYLQRIELIEEEMKNRSLGDLIEDNYSEIVSESIKVNEIGSEIVPEE